MFRATCSWGQGFACDKQPVYLLSPFTSLIPPFLFVPPANGPRLHSFDWYYTMEFAYDFRKVTKADTPNDENTNVAQLCFQVQLKNQFFPQQEDFHRIVPAVSLAGAPVPATLLPQKEILIRITQKLRVSLPVMNSH